MKVLGLDGREYVWNLANYHNKPNINPSSNHLRCRELLSQLYPTDAILEEVGLPDCSLRLDFYLPRLSLAIECQGQQHYEYTSHFHKHRLGFADAKRRDNRKREWCELNRINLIELPYNEDIEEWKKKIITRH